MVRAGSFTGPERASWPSMRKGVPLCDGGTVRLPRLIGQATRLT